MYVSFIDCSSCAVVKSSFGKGKENSFFFFLRDAFEQRLTIHAVVHIYLAKSFVPQKMSILCISARHQVRTGATRFKDLRMIRVSSFGDVSSFYFSAKSQYSFFFCLLLVLDKNFRVFWGLSWKKQNMNFCIPQPTGYIMRDPNTCKSSRFR